MKKAWIEDRWIWLFDLAHGNLNESAILMGFLKHYALCDKKISDVQSDLHFHTAYGDTYMESAMGTLRKTLEHQIVGEKPERTKGQDAVAEVCEHVGQVIGDFLVDLTNDLLIEHICVNEGSLVQTCRAYSQSLSDLKIRK